MTNPRMNERNRIWKRRVTAVGVASFVAFSALIGKQAEQSQTANAAAVTTSAQPSTTSMAVAGLQTNSGDVSSDTAVAAAPAVPTVTASQAVTVPSTTNTTTSSSSSSSTRVNTRTSASK